MTNDTLMLCNEYRDELEGLLAVINENRPKTTEIVEMISDGRFEVALDRAERLEQVLLNVENILSRIIAGIDEDIAARGGQQ
jgi:hypothetical protein